MKTWLIYFNKFLSLFLVWMLVNLGPLNECRWQFSTFFVSVAKAESDNNVRDQATLNRLNGCENIKAGSTEGVSGDKCSIKAHELDNYGAAETEMWLSTIVVWLGAFIAMMTLSHCLTKTIKCGWAVAISSVAGLALLAGEVVAIIKHKTILKKIEYRPDMLRKHKAECEANSINGSGTGSVGTIDGQGVCEQLQALKDQKEAYEAMKSAMQIKAGLQIAAGVAYLIAMIMEYAGVSKIEAEASGGAADAATTPPKVVAENAATAAEAGPGAGAKLAAGEAATLPYTGFLTSSGLRMTGIFTENFSYSIDPSLSVFARAQGYYLPELTAPAIAAPGMPFAPISLASSTPVHLAIGNGFQTENAVGMGGFCGASVLQFHFWNNDLDHQWKDEYLPINRQHFAYKFLIKERYYEWNHLIDDYLEQKLTNDEQLAFQLKQGGASPSMRDYHFLRYMALYEPGLLPSSGLLEFILATATADIKGGDDGEAVNVNNILTKILGFAGAIAGVVIGLLVSSSGLFDTLYGSPWKRGLWHTGQVVALAVVIGITYGLAIPEVEENIGVIDAILNSSGLNPSNIKNATSKTIPYNEVSVDMLNAPPFPVIPSDQPPLPCPGGGDGKGNCKDIGNQVDSALASLNLQGLSGLAGAVKTLGKEMGGSRDMSTGALKSAGVLAAAHGKLSKKAKDMYGLLQKKAASHGMKVPDYDTNAKNANARMMKTVKDYLKNKGINPRDLVAGMGGPGEIPKDEAKQRTAEQIAKKPGAAAAAAPANPLDGMNFENLGTDVDAGLQAGAENTPAKDLDDSYQVPNNDIGSDSNADIFQMLSSRYLKTAYPIFFEEDKGTGKTTPPANTP